MVFGSRSSRTLPMRPMSVCYTVPMTIPYRVKALPKLTLGPCRVVNVYVPVALFARLEDYATSVGCSYAAVMRAALDSYLSTHADR